MKHPLTVALEPLIEPWRRAEPLPEISLAQKETLKIATRMGLTHYLSSLTGSHPLDYKRLFAEEAAKAYFEMVPLKKIIEEEVNAIDPTWIPRFGYAPFVRLSRFFPERRGNFNDPFGISFTKYYISFIDRKYHHPADVNIEYFRRHLEAMRGIISTEEDFAAVFLITEVVCSGTAVSLLKDVIKNSQELRILASIAGGDKRIAFLILISIDSHSGSSSKKEAFKRLLHLYLKHQPANSKEEMAIIFEFVAQEEGPIKRETFRFLEEHSFFDEMSSEELMMLIQDYSSEEDLLIPLLKILVFQRRELFSKEVINHFSKLFLSPKTKHLLFYLQMQRKSPPAFPRDLFPHHQKVREILVQKQNPKVFVYHNIKDGMGDEIIRNATLLQALLDINESLEIVLYTGRPFLYSHPRVKVIQLAEELSFPEESFDLVIDHDDGRQRYYDRRGEVEGYLGKYPPKIYLKTNKANDTFVSEKIRVESEEIPSSNEIQNVYDPIYLCCAELGLPFRAGAQGAHSHEGSIFVAERNFGAEDWWRESVSAKNKSQRPVVIVNGFGGEGEAKGFTKNEYRNEYSVFAEVLKELIDRGYFVVLLPNHQQWGNFKRAHNVVNHLAKLDPALKQFVTIAPEPIDDPLLHKYLVHFSQKVVTVEGGMMHLAYNMGKPVEVLIVYGSGNVQKWFSYARTKEQVVRPKILLGPADPTQRRLTLSAKKAAGTTVPAQMTGLGESGKPLKASTELLQWHLERAATSSDKIKALIDRLRAIDVKKLPREYAEAGWDRIDWDQLLENFPSILKSAANKLSKGEIQIQYHERFEEIGFYPVPQSQNNEPPVFAFWSTEKGKKIVHITNGLRKEALKGSKHAKFLFQVLFHEVLESELPVPDRLKHPIMTALEPLIENWEVAGAPPLISLAQKMTLHYAAERNMISYLESLVETHPFDFGKAFHQLRVQLLSQLKRKAISNPVAFPDPQLTATLVGSAA